MAPRCWSSSSTTISVRRAGSPTSNTSRIIEKYRATGQLKFVLKHFPLERECNAAVQSDLHVAACEAAAAVVMAQSRGTADKLEEWFFANQPSLTPDRVKEAAAVRRRHQGLRRAVCPRADAGEDRRRARRAARREVDADLHHQRSRDRRLAAGSLLRSGHPAGALAIAGAARTASNAETAGPSEMTAAGPRWRHRRARHSKLNASRDSHRGAHQGLLGRFLAQAALPRARAPVARGAEPARSSVFSVPTAPARRPR